jgi:hypothetical protein
MGQVDEAITARPHEGEANNAWAESMREIMREVIASLPDHATLGELVGAVQSNRAMAPLLDIFTVQELIDIVKKRPKSPPTYGPANGQLGGGKRGDVHFDAEGNPLLELDAPAVIRRRADVPDGDIRLLRTLAERGPQREGDLAQSTALTAEQLRIIVRHLRTKGYIHIEGSGTKRRLKITRHGSAYLRRND